LSANRIGYIYDFLHYYIGGDSSASIRDNSFMYGRDTLGSDGTNYGIHVESNSIYESFGTQTITVTKEDDKSDYTFYIKRTSASAEPTPEVGELRIWRDPDDNKTYLIYNDTDEGVRKVELT
jgi:hypothetical protein